MTAARPLVLGHRGASAHAGDNTLEAFRLAVAHGADGVELDVRLTSDAVMVLHHDPKLPGHGIIAAKTFDELRHNLPDVPTLDEAADVLDDLIINVEIKNDPREPDYDVDDTAAAMVADWVKRRELVERVIVSSFNPATVDAVRSADDGLTTGQLVNPLGSFEDQLVAARDRGHQWFLPHKSALGRRGAERAAAVHDAGLLLGSWTVDEPDRLVWLAGIGVDAVIANDPRAALKIYAG